MADIISSNLSDDDKNSWRTDPRVFRALDKEFNFNLDVCASDANHLCEYYLTKENDALRKNWSHYADPLGNDHAFCNPPYSRGMIKEFMLKAIEQKKHYVTTVFLVPATLDAKWLPLDHVSEIRIITGGRLSFLHPVENKKINGSTKGSMIVIFRPSINPLNIKLIDRDELLKQGEN